MTEVALDLILIFHAKNIYFDQLLPLPKVTSGMINLYFIYILKVTFVYLFTKRSLTHDFLTSLHFTSSNESSYLFYMNFMQKVHLIKDFEQVSV